MVFYNTKNLPLEISTNKNIELIVSPDDYEYVLGI